MIGPAVGQDPVHVEEGRPAAIESPVPHGGGLLISGLGQVFLNHLDAVSRVLRPRFLEEQELHYVHYCLRFFLGSNRAASEAPYVAGTGRGQAGPAG